IGGAGIVYGRAAGLAALHPARFGGRSCGARGSGVRRPCGDPPLASAAGAGAHLAAAARAARAARHEQRGAGAAGGVQAHVVRGSARVRSLTISYGERARTMNKIIQELNGERATRKIPDFNPGDTVVVQVKVVEGDRERVQAYEGVVIAKKNRGLNSSFTVRKISHGEGVERVFQTFSPSISEVSVKRRGAVRRAKLYYLRDLSGKAARIDEKI